MNTMNNMKDITDVEYNDDGQIIDCLSGSAIKDTPEERVRQRFIKILQSDYGYPKDCILREIPVQSGSSILTNESDGSPIRADIVVYKDKKSALKKDQGNILFVVECKKPNVTEGYAQLVSYIFNTSAIGGVWTNGEGISVFKKTRDGIGLEEILGATDKPCGDCLGC
jgi:type I restriction enzyme M protein